MKVSAIIAAAGYGKRLGQPKQFLELLGKPIVSYSLRVFDACELIDEIILVINQEDLGKAERLVAELGISKPVKFAIGGEERQDSVHHGLNRISEDTEIVVIHDGCRPLVTKSLIVELVSEAKASGAAIPGVPAKDTIKEVDEKNLVSSTLDRSILFNIQTPQAFKKDLIKEAYEHAQRIGYKATDDARLVERLGQPVKVVTGSYENIKITTPDDLVAAEAHLKARKES